MSQTAPAIPKGHPKGLAVLFTTEMWERFNFYGMRAVLSLFLAHALAMGDEQASIIYGGYLGLCYLTPMLGGYISDRYLGNRNCILLGGVTMTIGQLLLFYSANMYPYEGGELGTAKAIMWGALLVIILGNGLFKPNISSMVGQLYPKDQRSKLDKAFTIFYMGINLGALLGQTICPYVGDVKDAAGIRDLSAFKWGFLAAAIAMTLGTLVFLFLKNKYVVTPQGKAIGGKPDRHEVLEGGEATNAKFSVSAVLFLIASTVILYLLFQYISWDPKKMPIPEGASGLGGYFAALATSPVKTYVYPFIYASALGLAIFILTDKSLTRVETQRIIVLYIVAFFVIFFWGAFEQAGASLTFIADQQTDTNIFGWQMPPSMVQFFNGLFVVIFAIPFSIMWSNLQKRNLEPMSTVKQAIGLVLIGLGYLIIAFRVQGISIEEKIGIIWLIILYLMHTFGELCLSPIGLSLVAKLAPKRFASLLMGVWFIGNAAGYALTGTLSALLPPTGDKYREAQKAGVNLTGILNGTVQPSTTDLQFLDKFNIPKSFPSFAGFTIHNLFEFFMVFVILCIAAGIILYLLTPLIKRLSHGVR